MKLTFPVLLIVLFISYPKNYAQNLDKNTLAKAGNITISPEEFLERYEFTPEFGKQRKKNINSLKMEFLYSLIAEKLWALEAENEGLDTTEVIKFSSEEFEKMFVRDALFRKEIKNKISVSDEELIEGYLRNSSKLKVNFLFSEDKKEIDNLYNLLEQGIPFDSILSARPETDEQKKPEEIVYGQMQDDVEDSLYNLSVGKFTHPILTPDGWYIFKLVDKIESVLNTDKDKDDARATVKKIVEARKVNKLYDKYFEKFFKDKKIETDAGLFRSLADKLSKVLSEKREKYELKKNDPAVLEADDVLKIEKEFGKDSLAMIYAKFKENPVTLKNFIRSLAFDGFSVLKTNINFIRNFLDERTRVFIQQELLAREGFKQGLQYLPEVRREVEMRRQNYLYQLLRNQFTDTVKVSEKEIYAEYEKTNKEEKYPVLVNIVEILTDSLKTAKKYLAEIKQGKDFKELAKKYSKRKWTKKNGGEFGLFPTTSYGEIGKIAGTMKICEIYGPLKVPEGYSIFKLIDKQKPRTVEPPPFDKVKNEIKDNLQLKKEKSDIINFTVKLANKYGVEINTELLQSLQVTSINSFGYRFLGFGGRITAAPLLAPNVDWVEPWLNNLKVIQ